MNIYFKRLIKLKNEYHSECIFKNDDEYSNNFFDDNGIFTLIFFCKKNYQGYNNMMHGGIISGLIDSAMTQCLFGHGIIGYTVRLNIKYLKPVNIDNIIKIIVKIKEQKSDFFIELDAFAIQDNQKKIKANSKFWIVKKEDI